MRKTVPLPIVLLVCAALTSIASVAEATTPKGETTSQLTMSEPKEQRDARMKWWREARFGMFIHWGLYAIPAGAWEGRTDHAEWIMETAKIPSSVYDSTTARQCAAPGG